MRWIPFAALAVVAVAGCDPAPPVQAPAAAPSQEAGTTSSATAYAGRPYSAFAADPAFERYSTTALSAATTSRERFTHAMANQADGVLISGGGSQAVVFSGCAPSGCLEGLSVVAVDTQTGEAFIGVSDMAGQERLVENDRLEALLRLTSPSQTWDDPVRPQQR